jgi:hypothetical protein
MTTRSTMRPQRGSNLELSVSGTSARVALQAPTIGIYCETACYVKFGGDSVAAATNDYHIYVPAGQSRDIDTGGAGYVAVILASGSDTAYINEWVTTTLAQG